MFADKYLPPVGSFPAHLKTSSASGEVREGMMSRRHEVRAFITADQNRRSAGVLGPFGRFAVEWWRENIRKSVNYEIVTPSGDFPARHALHGVRSSSQEREG